MKHIKTKNNKTYNISFDPSKLDEIEVPKESKIRSKKYLDSSSIDDEYDLAAFAGNKMIFGFDYVYKNEKLFIPELDPVVIYFSSAQMFSKMIYSYKKELLENASKIKETNRTPLGDTMKQFESFFQFASSYIIMLHASIEAFTNKIIPLDYTFTDKEGNVRDIDWILRKLEIEKKIKEIIPETMNKYFHVEFGHKYEKLVKIRKFRDKLIHLKPKTEITNTRYKEFYREVIDFPYSEVIYAVRDYINFYEPDLIEECNCGKDIYFDIHIKN